MARHLSEPTMLTKVVAAERIRASADPGQGARPGAATAVIGFQSGGPRWVLESSVQVSLAWHDGYSRDNPGPGDDIGIQIDVQRSASAGLHDLVSAAGFVVDCEVDAEAVLDVRKVESMPLLVGRKRKARIQVEGRDWRSDDKVLLRSRSNSAEQLPALQANSPSNVITTPLRVPDQKDDTNLPKRARFNSSAGWVGSRVPGWLTSPTINARAPDESGASQHCAEGRIRPSKLDLRRAR